MTRPPRPPLRDATGMDAVGTILMSGLLVLTLGFGVAGLLATVSDVPHTPIERLIDLGYALGASVLAWACLTVMGVRR